MIQGPFMSVSNFPSNRCGRIQYNDVGLRFFGRVSHSASTLTLQFLSLMNELSNNESFGFRDISLLLNTYTVGSSSICGTGLSSMVTPSPCDCPEGQVKRFITGKCFPCDPACASCFGNGPTTCYQCAPGFYYTGTTCLACDASCSMCTGPAPTQCVTCQLGLFLYLGNTCIPECSPPFVQSSDGCNSYCVAPCPTAQYLYWDNSCSNTCPLPLQQVTTLTSIKKCIYPCETGEYLYWDGSCQESCAYPLSTRIDIGVLYCDYLCTVSNFLYWDGTCSATCDPPLVQAFDHNRQFCTYPCSSSEILYYYGSCLPYCNSPFVLSTVGTKRYCAHPCAVVTDFLYWDNTCHPSCLLPYEQHTYGKLEYCTLKCQTSESILWNGTCTVSCNPPKRLSSLPFGNVCSPPCDNTYDYYYFETGTCSSTCNSYSILLEEYYFACLPYPPGQEMGMIEDVLLIASDTSNEVSFLSVARLVQPIRYLKVNFPPRLETFLASKTVNPISFTFGMKMSSSMENEITNHTLPKEVQRREFHSSFLVNFWPETLLFFILLGIGLFLLALELLAKRLDWTNLWNICRGIRFITLFNFILVLITSNVDNIIIFSSFELKTFDGDTNYAYWSLLLSILMICTIPVTIAGSFYLSYKAQQKKTENSKEDSEKPYKTFLNTWEPCQIAFRGYKSDHFTTRLFYLIYFFRFLFPMIIASSGYTKPLSQATFYLVVSVATLIFTIVVRPIKSMINQVQLIVIEAIVLIINICTVILVICSNKGEQNSIGAIYLGDLIILANIVINVLVVGFLIFKVGLGIKYALHLRKLKSPKEQGAWLYLLFIYVQQAGLGFEHAKPIYTPIKTESEKNNNRIIVRYTKGNKTLKEAEGEFYKMNEEDSETKREEFTTKDDLISGAFPISKIGQKKEQESRNDEMDIPPSDAFPITKIGQKTDQSRFPLMEDSFLLDSSRMKNMREPGNLASKDISIVSNRYPRFNESMDFDKSDTFEAFPISKIQRKRDVEGDSVLTNNLSGSFPINRVTNRKNAGENSIHNDALSESFPIMKITQKKGTLDNSGISNRSLSRVSLDPSPLIINNAAAAASKQNNFVSRSFISQSPVKEALPEDELDFEERQASRRNNSKNAMQSTIRSNRNRFDL